MNDIFGLPIFEITGICIVLLANYLLRLPFREIGLDGDTGCLIYPGAHHKKGETMFKDSWVGYNYLPVVLYWIIHRLVQVNSHYRTYRNFFTLYNSLAIIALYLFCSQIFPQPIPFLAIIIYTIMTANPLYFSYYGPKEFFILVPCMISFTLAVVALKTNNPSILFLSILLISLGPFSIKPHFIILSFPLVIAVLESNAGSSMIIALFAGYTVSFLVVVSFILVFGNLKEYISYFFTFLKVITPRLPVSRLKIFVRPLLIFLVTGIWGALTISFSGYSGWEAHLVVTSCITTLAMIIMFQRGEWSYLYLPVFPSLAVLSAYQLTHFTHNFFSFPFNWLTLTLLLLLFIQSFIATVRYYTSSFYDKDRVWHEFLPQHEGIVNKHIIEEIVEIVQSETEEEDYIAIIGHTPQVYTMANRRSAMRCLQIYNIYYHLYPHWQEIFVKNLKEKKPKLIISNCSWYRTINMEHLEMLTGFGYRFFKANSIGSYKIFKLDPEKNVIPASQVDPEILQSTDFHQPIPLNPNIPIHSQFQFKKRLDFYRETGIRNVAVLAGEQLRETIYHLADESGINVHCFLTVTPVPALWNGNGRMYGKPFIYYRELWKMADLASVDALVIGSSLHLVGPIYADLLTLENHNIPIKFLLFTVNFDLERPYNHEKHILNNQTTSI